MEQKEYSLRERKHAKTKIAIMNAFIRRLESTRFDDISIRQICRSVEVSEGTFFNYFPEKIDIINYYIHLMFLKIIWKACKDAPRDKYISLINAVFAGISEELNNANIVYQMISVMLIQQGRPKDIDIPEIERRIVFPDYAGIEDTPSVFIEDFFKDCLEEALKKKQLPKSVKIEEVLVSLSSIMVGTLVAVKFQRSKNAAYYYVRQLKSLWEGLGVKV